MSRICQITGKKAMVGNHVSHSKKHVKRKFYPNLATRKFYFEEEDRWITLKVSTSGMRIINKDGLKVALENAKRNGHINNF
ncbi:MAG: 50S ribosomal protein L28 [Bacteroidales bacterium]|jgi:large subunit ribosomal protein L28|nr:50S ribosomal protein L28 [Bacteroidales bacterium]